jgi:hypothetical protein
MTTTPTIWKTKFNPNFQSGAGIQNKPQSIGLANGNILTIWEDETGGPSPGWDIMGQMFSPLGVNSGPVFQINYGIVNQDETAPQIAALPDGGFVVVYASYDFSLGNYILVQRFNSSGAEVSNGRHFITGNEVGLGTWDVAVDNNGNYLVAFERNNDVKMIVYNYVSNNPLPEYDVAQNTSDIDQLGQIATFNNGNVITVSSEYDDLEGIEYKITQSGTGNVVVGSVAVAGGDDNLAGTARVAVLTGGQFVIVYNEYGSSIDWLRMRIGASDAPGATLGPAIDIARPAYAQVVALRDGGFMVVWADLYQNAILGTRYNADGTVVGAARFQIATGIAASGPAELGELALTSDGRVLVTWRDSNGEIAEAIVDPRDATIYGTENGEVLTAQVGDSFVFGNGGNDTLYGLNGRDTLDGGAGMDTLRGGYGGDTYYLSDVTRIDPNVNLWFYDTVIEMDEFGFDTIRIARAPNAKTTYVLPANVENGIIVGSQPFNLTGNEENNELTGNSAANVLDGGLGADTAIFSGPRSAYTITRNGAAVIVSGPDGTDTLTNIERFQFSDRMVGLPTPNDFNGDGRSDILWQNDNGTPAVWLMSGTVVQSRGPILTNPGAAWHAKTAGDFNGDSRADIFWQNDDGTPAVWLMDGVNVVTHGPALGNPGPSWHAKEAADFNGDGKADILWQNDNGMPAVWLMNGTVDVARGAPVANPGPTWHVKAAADFNGDGKADILWQHDNGAPAVWLMDGLTDIARGAPLSSPGRNWQVKDAGDFNSDGKADILWQKDDGTPAIWLMDGLTDISRGAPLSNPGPAWHIRDAADRSGDGKADILWQNDSGALAVWLMDGTAVSTFGAALKGPSADWHMV